MLNLLDDILLSQGRPKTTWKQFNNFFEKFDSNGDGVISMNECARFVRNFLDTPARDSPARIRRQRSITPSRVLTAGDEYSLVLEKDSEIERLKNTIKLFQNKAEAADDYKNSYVGL